MGDNAREIISCLRKLKADNALVTYSDENIVFSDGTHFDKNTALDFPENPTLDEVVLYLTTDQVQLRNLAYSKFGRILNKDTRKVIENAILPEDLVATSQILRFSLTYRPFLTSSR